MLGMRIVHAQLFKLCERKRKREISVFLSEVKHDKRAKLLIFLIVWFTEWLDKTFFPTNKQRLRNAYEMACDALEEVGIPFLPGECGLFIWVDFREVYTLNNTIYWIHCVIYLKIGYFTVVFLVAKPLIWSEAEGDLVVIETSI